MKHYLNDSAQLIRYSTLARNRGDFIGSEYLRYIADLTDANATIHTTQYKAAARIVRSYRYTLPGTR